MIEREPVGERIICGTAEAERRARHIPVEVRLCKQVRLLVAADERERHSADVLLDVQRQDVLVGLVDRREIGAHLPQVRGDADAGESVDRRVAVTAVRCSTDVGRRVSRPRQQTERHGLQMAAAPAGVDRVEAQAVGQAAVNAVWILVAHLLVDARPVRILLEALVHQVDVRAFSRRVAQRQARRPLIAPIDPLAIVDILRVAVAREIDECATHPEIVGDRNVERAA